MPSDYGTYAASSTAQKPDAILFMVRHKRCMAIDMNILRERIAQRLKEMKISARKASLLATNQPDAIRYIQVRDAEPSAGRLQAIADALNTSVDYLTGRTSDQPDAPSDFVIKATVVDGSEQILSVRRDLFHAIPKSETAVSAKIYETVAGPEFSSTSATGLEIKIHTFQFVRMILDVAPKPKAHIDLQFVGLRFHDTAMHPVFMEGDKVLYTHDLPVAPGDYAIIAFLDDAGGALLRRVVAISDDTVTMEQFSPPAIIQLPLSEVEVMAKVMTLQDYLTRPDPTK